MKPEVRISKKSLFNDFLTRKRSAFMLQVEKMEILQNCLKTIRMQTTSSSCVSFPAEIQSGLLEVISPSVHFYPDFSRLRESFGDPKERVRSVPVLLTAHNQSVLFYYSSFYFEGFLLSLYTSCHSSFPSIFDYLVLVHLFLTSPAPCSVFKALSR